MLITDPRQIDAAWVESALRRSGALSGGSVAEIRIDHDPRRMWSRITRIAVSYSKDASGERPGHLLLKLCGAEGGAFGPAEVRYYTSDYAGLVDAPIPRCHDALYVEKPRRYHLLLADLSSTHENFDHRHVTEGHALALATALATLHAHRWGAERLGAIGLTPPDRGDFVRYVDHVARGLEPLLALTDGEIDRSWGPRLRTIFSRLADRYAERASDRQTITQTHGDINPGNILVPINGETPLYLIDRQPFDWSLTNWLGASDLVLAMIPWWEPSIRRRFESATLRAYHQALATRGVADYPFDQLMEDYRLCIVESIALAVEWCALQEDREPMRWLWNRELHRALAAYDDHRCHEMWE